MTPTKRSPCPDFLLSYQADSPLGELLDLYKGVSTKTGRGMPVALDRHRRKIVDLLSNAFRASCCYCETATDKGEIERFRPRRIGGRGAYASEQPYAHLAFDWRNLYWACPTCNRYKADRFPVDGEHAPPNLSYDEIVDWERPLIIDPCRDDPDEHLQFLEAGVVMPLSHVGEQTIKLFALNRAQLVSARADQARLFSFSTHNERVSRAAGGGAHRAVWRQLLNTYNAPSEFAAKTDRPPSKVPLVNTETGEGIDTYLDFAQYVSRIQITNFGPIAHLDLDLSRSESPRAPCFALLGENGVGKSTVLRALALCLAGKSYAGSMRLSSNNLLSEGALQGSVSVSIVGAEHDVSITLGRDKPLLFSEKGSRSLVLAYGATRLLPRGSHKPKAGKAHAKIDNLFDPFLPLSHPAEWLEQLSPHRLDEVNTVLSSLMPQEHQVQVVQDGKGGNVRLSIGGFQARLIGELSDGYQSMLGMAVEIMKVLFHSETSIESAEGVVIIDELGNHFHPAWRLQCLSALRQAFPRAQFIYSTHDPLCLRGLYDGEVAVLMRDKTGAIYALDDLPSVTGLRVDQLLGSEHFGLRSTVDPQMDLIIQRYELLMKKRKRTKAEQVELDSLIERLTDARYLGSTRRERLALQLLDADQEGEPPAHTTTSAQELSDATVARLKSLMAKVTKSTPADEGEGR